MPRLRSTGLLALPVLAAGLGCYLTGESFTGFGGSTGTVDSTEADAVAVVSGNNQTGPFNTLLPDPLVVRVTNVVGDSLEDVVVNWTVLEGGGSLSVDSSSTDAAGLAQVSLTLGPGGDNRVRATVSGTTLSTDFAATAVVSAAPPPAAAVRRPRDP